jgi:cytochrome c553
MRKLVVILLVSGAMVFQYCNSSKKAARAASASAVSYNTSIKPIIETHCTPCHIEGKGKKKPLDNYANASSSINDILERIQKNPGDHGFMPAMHPKLSDSTINMFVAWKNSGLKE